ncbi:MAG: ATP-dependent RecD-like DNA helicase [Clostridia bacterium]|nr:ATP-dependent RecD-like DNA helicase [Clostridia bacterium]
MSEERLFEGEVTKILFQNSENGYCVCLLTDADGEERTLVGTLPSLSVGESLRAKVKAKNHATYGEQWQVLEFEKALPQDTLAITRYLASRALKGIGKKRAEKIVERFGADTLSVLEHSPEMLSAIPGISARLAKSIGEEFRTQFGMRQVLLFFGGTFGPKTSLAIYNALGSSAVELVRKNPYLLCERVRGVGFLRADELAQKIGYAKESEQRVQAGLLFALSQAYHRDGQVYLPREELFSVAAGLLGVEVSALEAPLEALCREGRVVAEDERIYLTFARDLECEAARRLLTLSSIKLFHKIPRAEEVIIKTQEAEGVEYSEAQRAAILAAATHPFSIITGGPGTGKTTITRALVRMFTDLGMQVCLAAPTGRAAKRLSEKSHIDARTLHRVLEMAYTPEDSTPRFSRNEENPLSESVFLIDEVSMVDMELLVHFLRAVKPGSRVVLIGDADQLPSVGAGNVLSDLISSGVFCTTFLDVIYRQGQESAILRFAHEVREGGLHALKENEGDLFFLRRATAAQTAATVGELLSRRLPRAYGEESLFNTQVLAPARRGEAGCKNLNRLLQAALNPPSELKREYAFGDVIFREGDRVMQIRNNYDLEGKVPGELGLLTSVQGIFNGDVGVIRAIDFAREVMVILFEGRMEVEYPFADLEDVEHAYAVTVHKSQGSEYDTVVLSLFGTPPALCRRALLYTAVTRAKRRLIIVGSDDLSRRMARDGVGSGRYSTLAMRLSET